jgi:hypothetical protein
LARSTTAFRVRVGLLSFVLFVVVAWAIRDVRSRRARTAWDHTLNVAVVVIESSKVAPEAITALRAQRPNMEERLRDELRRYRPGAPPPFSFTVLGPTSLIAPAPVLAGDGVADLAGHAWAQWRWISAIDRAVGVDASAFDSRIYVVVSPLREEETGIVEGASEQGGRVGTVAVTLDAVMADFAWIVIAHELFHTLGATDKYDPGGRTLVPEGLAEPDLSPTLPQRYVELMARNRPVSATEERPPTSMAEVAVGPVTSHEIGWSN